MTTTQQTSRFTEDITLRVYGQNLTMARFAWLDMLDEMKPDSRTYLRIRDRLESASA